MATLRDQDFRLYDSPSTSPDRFYPLFQAEILPENSLTSTRQGSRDDYTIAEANMADTRENDKVRREEMWPALEERRDDALAVSKYRNLSSRRTPVDQVTTATTDAKGKGKRCLSDEFDRIEANVRAGGNGTGASITRPTEGDRREEAETRVVEPEAVETEAAPEHVCEPSKATGNPRINQNACSNKGIGVVNIQICPVM